MAVCRVSLKELDEMVASGEMVAAGLKCPKRFERAFKRTEPHLAHPADIAELADEISDKWLRGAVRFGDELRELNLLFALPDPRTS